ncbi:hypothetical protein RI845_11590 [Thalassotalea nanhaiensis]|uniref:Lipoprotein n=1 Tax=Thalassotalea nanhaiensis TaxID=3065648 RepID=A0ABY9TEE5_9GAMM|nr:hypothetical protein RI845_11590 [Colwelliaceae bacterium SQ345]
MKKVLSIMLITSFFISACASNETTFGPRVQSNSPLEAAAYLGIAVAMVEKPQKTTCGNKSAENKRLCEQQIVAIKKSIAKAQQRKSL